jgi:hypothetical protein
VQLVELRLGAFLELLELHLQFALVLPLHIQRLLEVINGNLGLSILTSMSSTCSLTVVVRPSLESVLPPRDIIRSFRLVLCRIVNLYNSSLCQ